MVCGNLINSNRYSKLVTVWRVIHYMPIANPGANGGPFDFDDKKVDNVKGTCFSYYF